MTYLSEDPTFLAGGLFLLAGAFLLALKVTQQGKYAIRAGVALVLAAAVISIEWVWVTDNERIEQVVYDLAGALQSSDNERVSRVLAHMMPTVQYLQGETALSAEATRAMIQQNLSKARFNFVRISGLQASAGRQSRRGLAEFRVISSGSLNTSHGMLDTGHSVTTWSLGFQETEPGVWKVNRITPVSVPYGGYLAMPNVPPSDRSQLGFNDRVGAPRTHGRSLYSGSRRYNMQKSRGTRLPGPSSTAVTN